jgi:hypothetical protein
LQLEQSLGKPIIQFDGMFFGLDGLR